MATTTTKTAPSKARRCRKPEKQKPLARLLSLAVAHAARLSLALFVASLLAPLALPSLERKLDFEESGPLPGSARPNIRTAPGAEARFAAAARAAEALLAEHYHHQGGEEQGGGPGPTSSPLAFFDGLARELEARGLEVARLTEWRADWPYGRSRGRRCAALHAVLRSPRGDGKESVAVVTPLALQPRPRALRGQTRGDAALALAAAHALVAGHLRDAAPWLAKDIVWIVPDASCGGAEAVGAWLAAYHQEVAEDEEVGEETAAGRRRQHDDDISSSSSGSKRRPFVRAGVIQQALVLQFESLASSSSSAEPLARKKNAASAPAPAAPAPPSTVQLALVGGDGQLPKTDFYWLVRYYCSKWVRLAGCAPPGFPSAPPGGKASGEDGPLLRAVARAARAAGGRGQGDDDAAAERARAYARRLGLVLRFAAQQARGLPTGPHAPFKWRNTDAVTIAFVGGGGGGGVGGDANNNNNNNQQQQQRAKQAAELLELSVRSCSVLVERLHHAFFLYALSSPDHFVSVERYIGPACALIGVLVLQAAAARRALGGDEGEGKGEEEGEGRPTGSWAASARVAVLLPLLCGALGWSLRAGLEAASLASGGGGAIATTTATRGGVPLLLLLAAAARRLASGGGPRVDPGDVAAALGPGYAVAEGLRLGSLAVAVAVLAWVGLAEGGAAVEGFLLRGGGGGGGCGGGGGRGGSSDKKKKNDSSKRAASAAASALDWRMLKVLMLCGAAAPLAGMACSNWALAHAVALACAPLAFAAPSSLSPSSSQRGQLRSTPIAAARLRIAAVVLCSPLGLALLAAGGAAAVAGPEAAAEAVFGGPGGLSSAGDAARWLVLEGTSWATWSFAWCVYAPLWVASAWIVSLSY